MSSLNVLRKKEHVWEILDPKTNTWTVVCVVTDPLWGPKCAQATELFYPTRE
jgi:hypothetical protein